MAYGKVNVGGGGKLTPKMFGCTKMAVDTVSFDAHTSYVTPVEHSLGEKPKLTFLFPNPVLIQPYSTESLFIWSYGGSFDYTIVNYYGSNAGKGQYSTTVNPGNETHVSLPASANTNQFLAGTEYTLITMA